MPNTTITQWGLDYASSASPVGTLIAPLYWVPVYDSRIDGLIHDSVLPVSAFSACVNVSATAPTGEIIWNVDGVTDRYALSDNDKVFILSGSNTSKASDILIDNPIQSQQWQINELNGTPLAPHFSATEAYFTPANIKWNTSATFAATPWDNTPVLSGKDKYFRVIDYYPVSANTEDSKLRGMVKCRLAKDIGTVKFNKVALYIEKFNASGVESPDEPVLFAECQLKTTVIKTSMGTNGFDDVTVDVQIDLHSISANWNDVFFSTSGDYWSRVPDGVYYPERVGIGSFIDSILSPQASLHARRTRAMVSLGITDAPVARFDFDDTNYHEIDVSNTGLVHETFNSDSGNFGLYFQPAYKTIYPDMAGVGLGMNSSRFRYIYLDADGINIYDSSSYGYIREGFNSGSGYIQASDNVSIAFTPIGYNPAVALMSYIEGADIRRRSTALINYTLNTASDYLIISDINESDSIWGDYYSPLPTSQYGVTHNNILYALDDPSYVDWIGTSGKVKIYGRGEIDLNGPVMLDAFVYTGGGTTPYPFGALLSRKAKVLMAAALTTDPYSLIVQALVADAAGDPSTEWANIASGMTSSGEYQILGRIRHSEDLRPLIADKSIIGVPQLLDETLTTTTQTKIAYNRFFVNQIGAYFGQIFPESSTYAGDNRVSAIYAKDIGTTDNISGWGRIHRMAMVGLIRSGYSNLKGTSGSGFDFGYITSDPDIGDTEYPQNGTAYPNEASHPTYYGLWPKTYMVLGNRQDMLDSVGTDAELLYRSGKHTIDLICTRFMSITNTMKFEGAFDIVGKYHTNPFGFYPESAGAATVVTKTNWTGSTKMPGIHKTALSPGVTLGDSDTKLDYAYIDNIFAGSLTLAGILTVGGIQFAKTTTWSPDTTIITNPTTDGLKSSIITDVISLPMDATSENQSGTTTPKRVFLNYQFTNRVITGYLDMVTNYSMSGFNIIHPIYNEVTPSCQYAYNTNSITLGRGWFWKAPQTITFIDSDNIQPTGNRTFNVGQYVVITSTGVSPADYKANQHLGNNNHNMLYGVVTAFSSSPYSIEIDILYYRYWSRASGTYPIAGSVPLTGYLNIITAMPFLLPAPKSRITAGAHPSSTNLLVQKVYSRGNPEGVTVPEQGIAFSDIGIDAVTSNGAKFNGIDTIQPFTFLTIKPSSDNSIDLIT